MEQGIGQPEVTGCARVPLALGSRVSALCPAYLVSQDICSAARVPKAPLRTQPVEFGYAMSYFWKLLVCFIPSMKARHIPH